MLRRRQLVVTLAGVALAALAACNALNGAGDLTFGACEGCPAANEGGPGTETGADAIASGDGGDIPDAPGSDTAKEGPGGVLDPSFGVGGMITIDPPPVDPHAVAVRSDGRILVAGAYSGDLTAVAFTPSGALDTSFGGDGRVSVPNGNSSVATAVAFDSKGRAVLGGSAVVVGPTVSTRYWYVVRMSATDVDPDFAPIRGSGGGQDVRGVAITSTDGVAFAFNDKNDFNFALLGENGLPAAGFGLMGMAGVANVGGDPTGIVVAPDGFVAGGTGNLAGVGNALAAAKVSSNGQAVAAFGTMSKVLTKVGPNNSEYGRAIAIQADQSLLLGGDYDTNLTTGRRVTAVLRFTAAGVLDPSYGAAGKVTIDHNEPLVTKDTQTTNTNLIVDAKGRVLAVGTVQDRPIVAGGDRQRGWVVRLRADGTFDPLFGTQGRLFLGATTSRLDVRGAALQPDGKLVVVAVDVNGGSKLVLFRIITSTTL